jgi:hypothetical protein
MEMPFTVKQFFDLFGTYNDAIWPSQIVAYLLGITALGLALKENRKSSRIVSAILALFWIWIGIVYHIIHFSGINTAAIVFGAFFTLEGLLLLHIGTINKNLSFAFHLRPLPVLGSSFIIYAMVIYPLLGLNFGHTYPKTPMFGVAPCPTTIFTIGILLWATKPVSVCLLAIPFAWSIIGMGAALNLGVLQDYGLVVVGILGTASILLQNRWIDSKHLTRPHEWHHSLKMSDKT